MIGQMQEFNPDNEPVTKYLESFQMFISANAIGDDKLVPTLLTGSARHYSLLRGLVLPALDIVGLLKKHYDLEPIVIAERFHFYERSQKGGDSCYNTGGVFVLKQLA